MLNTLGFPKARAPGVTSSVMTAPTAVSTFVKSLEIAKGRRVIIWPGGVGRSGSNSLLFKLFGCWLFGFLVTRRRVTRLVWVGDGNAREAQLQTELQPQLEGHGRQRRGHRTGRREQTDGRSPGARVVDAVCRLVPYHVPEPA